MKEELSSITEPLYQIFARYPLNPEMGSSPALEPEDKRQPIFIKPLKELQYDDLKRFSFKSMTTWGDIEDFKHFLPRLLEVEVYKNNGAHYFTSKLEYAVFEEWPLEEQKAIQIFLLNYTLYLIKRREFSEAGEFLKECSKYYIKEGVLWKHFEISVTEFFHVLLDNFAWREEIGDYVQMARHLWSAEELEMTHPQKLYHA